MPSSLFRGRMNSGQSARRGRWLRAGRGLCNRLQVDAHEPTHHGSERRDVEGQAVVREVSHRVAEGAELPVQHGEDARLRGVEDEVVQPVVAVHDDRALVAVRVGDALLQPSREALHAAHLLSPARAVLPAPPADGALRIAAVRSELLQPNGLGIDRVQRAEHLRHGAVHREALLPPHPREVRLLEHAPFDILHDVELLPDH